MMKLNSQGAIETIETLYRHNDDRGIDTHFPEQDEISETGLSILDDIEHYLRHPCHREEIEDILLDMLSIIVAKFQ